MKFYITTPIYYINAEPHLGHAYSTMVADAIARSRRLLGEDVFFLTGTDEHGQKVERAAQKAGEPPPVFADRVSELYRQLFKRLNVSNDDFIRTTEPRHYRAAEAIWRRVRDAGDIYKGTYEGWYCTVDEVFVPEAQLSADRRCPICGGAVERLSEESYYFRLSRYQQPLLDLYRSRPEFIEPDIRRNEMIAFVEAGLDDLSVSRTSFKWGIPVPDDPAHVMYVWFDALTNYLTAVGFGSGESGAEERFNRYWPADVHLMGKEIVRQHSVYWPAFLMSAGLAVPKRIVGHGLWMMQGAKMSKSLGNVVRPHEYIDIFGVDALRYFVMREMVLGQDASFADESFLTRYNADLANDLGNLASRVATMIQRYRDGIVPEPRDAGQADVELAEAASRSIEGVIAGVQTFAFSRALAEVWDLISRTNKYIVGREPWALARDPSRQADLDTTLYGAADMLRIIAALIDPVMPEAAERLRRTLGVRAESWVDLKPGSLPAGTKLGAIEPLFPRIERTVEELRTMAAEQNHTANEASGAKPEAPGSGPQAEDTSKGRISLQDFMNVDLRVAKVLAAERVPKSKKLVKLRVDVGSEERTLVAGIGDAYDPEALLGKAVVIVANLQPAKLMGIESNGMVLAASPEGGKPVLLGFDEAPAPGTRVR
jgi:methionyl-tRNA synthetase